MLARQIPFICMLAAFWACGVTGAIGQTVPKTLPAAKVVDPTTWKPPATLPSLDPVYSDAEYAKRREVALKAINREMLKDPKTPVAGLKLTMVDSGRPADRHGLKLGDIIATINGAPPTHDLLISTVNSGQRFEMDFWSPARGRFTEQFDAGRIGTDTTPYFNASAYFLRLGPHDAKWEDDLLVATWFFETDPNLARAALARASRAGCKDPLLQIIHSLAQFASLHFDDSVAAGLAVLTEAPNEASPVLVDALIRGSAQMYHLDTSLELIRKYPGICPADFPAAVQNSKALHNQFMGHAPLGERPTVLASRMSSKDWTEIPQPAGFDQQMGSTVPASNWQKNHILHYAVATDSFAETTFGPGLQNFSMLIEFRGKPTNSGPATFWNEVGIDLSRVPEDSELTYRVLRASVAKKNAFLLDALWFNVNEPFPTPTFSPDQPQTLEVIVVGQRVEVLLNKTIVYDGPFREPEATRRIAGRIFICGMTVDVTKVEWRELLPMPAATQPK